MPITEIIMTIDDMVRRHGSWIEVGAAEEPVAIIRYGYPRVIPQQTRRDLDDIVSAVD